jgi:hypothetical protein
MFEVTGAGTQLAQNIVQPLLGDLSVALWHPGDRLQLRIVGARWRDVLSVAPQLQKFCGISTTGSTRSTMCVSMAARGIP